MKRVVLTVCLVVVAALGLTACSAPAFSPSSGAGSESAPMNPGVPLTPGTERDALATDQQVITTAWMSVRTERPGQAADHATELTTAAGGKVAGRTENAASGNRSESAELTLRIPSSRMNEVTEQLKELGTLVTLTINATDVTDQTRDLDARITALRTSVDRLLALLASATSTSDLIEIEASLSERQAELDSLVAQRAVLADQVEYSTLQLTLLSNEVVPSAGPGDFWGGLAVGWSSLVAFVSGAAVVLGVLLPWIGVVVVSAGLITLVIVLATRKRSKPLS